MNLKARLNYIYWLQTVFGFYEFCCLARNKNPLIDSIIGFLRSLAIFKKILLKGLLAIYYKKVFFLPILRLSVDSSKIKYKSTTFWSPVTARAVLFLIWILLSPVISKTFLVSTNSKYLHKDYLWFVFVEGRK